LQDTNQALFSVLFLSHNVVNRSEAQDLSILPAFCSSQFWSTYSCILKCALSTLLSVVSQNLKAWPGLSPIHNHLPQEHWTPKDKSK
jgi:hypothetical protein